MQITLNDQIAAFTKQGLILNANNTMLITLYLLVQTAQMPS